MTIWLLVLLAIIVAGALVWRSERRNRQVHGPSGWGGGMADRAGRARTHDEGRGASGGGGGV